MKKISKADSKKYVKSLTAFFDGVGTIEKTSETRTIWNVPTQAGNLKVTLPNAEDHVYCYTTYTKFDDVDEGRELTGHSNRFSGKWNFHTGSELPVTAVIYDVTYEIREILIK